ncbi:YdcF family protein [Thomasclavelia sp.]|uniref:YdcF family protein n=1 Tax=Thomasclavelia sp. TaxID=3025757 RepID=UPI002606889E|nr:YdcF family protein [Thomasclavelia sp.]
MKKIFKSLLTVFVSLTMLFSLTVNVAASESTVSSDEQRLISEILTYFSYSKGDFNEHNGWTASSITADVDIQRCLNELKELNPESGEAFTNIMDYWIYADTTMPIYSGVLPDGLPTDNSLCIVTLGFQLNQTTGEMQQELIDRLIVTLESSIKYPNASIVVTGGGTSPADPSKTEGEEMAKWLIANGVDANRIIVENKAPTTVGNATNTFKLLKEKPEIKSIAMISSSSHIQRAVAIFQAVFQLEAYKANTDAIEILNNTSCPVDRKEKLSQQMNSVTEAINTCLNSKAKLIPDLSLSTLDSIEITNVNDTYGKGAKLEPKVIAHFTTPAGVKYDLDVTDKAQITNIDTNKSGSQVLKATYSYGDIVKDVSKTITVGTPATDTSKGNATVSVKTGDETYALTFVSLMMLTACGYTYLRRKEL